MESTILFLDQGRAVPDAAMGHARVKHALEVGLDDGSGEVRIIHDQVPAFARPERLFTRHFRRLGQWNLGSVRWHLARSWGARRLVRHWLKSDRPDVVHVNTDQVSLLLGGLQREVPCVLSLDVLTIDWVRLKRGLATGPTVPPAFLRPIRSLERRALLGAPLNIAWTETVAQDIRWLAPEAHVAVLHPGLDLAAFRPREHAQRGEPARVLFVGGRWTAKGGPDLIAALGDQLGSSVLLDVVTTEDVEPKEGVTVHRAEPGSDTIAELFRSADVFCLPTYVDAVPWVVLEAMASCLPVVSTDIGSIPEMIQASGSDPCGLVVSPGDVEGLASALRSLLASPEQRERMGRAGRARTELVYDARRNTPRLIELLREIGDG